MKAELLDGAEEGDPRWLLAQLLEYHRREEKPAWWEYFHHLSLDPEELIEDGDTIGGLELVGEPVPDKQSFVYTFSFPPQEHKIGGDCVDPATEKGYHVSVDDEQGLVTLRRSKKRVDEALPRALIPPRPHRRLRAARCGQAFRPGLPRRLDRVPGARETSSNGARRELGSTCPRSRPFPRIESSYLFVQGPPGSGKTWNGARMAIALMRQGHRVGITSLSHKAIQKFLGDVRGAALEDGLLLQGPEEGETADGRPVRGRVRRLHRQERGHARPGAPAHRGHRLAVLARGARTERATRCSWTKAGRSRSRTRSRSAPRPRTSSCSATRTSSPQVSQGSHPPGADASVLAAPARRRRDGPTGHGALPRADVADAHRRFAGSSRRRSTRAGSSRRRYAPTRSRRTGERAAFPARRARRATGKQSPEEAARIAAEVGRLVGSSWRDEDGERALEPEDSSSSHRTTLRSGGCASRSRIRESAIGTVDKFQGQQAPVVFYSMASSSGEDVPRGLEFLLSRNRLNVAISRAQCLAYLVCSPRLLEVNCRTVEQMRLANALCRFVELAEDE